MLSNGQCLVLSSRQCCLSLLIRIKNSLLKGTKVSVPEYVTERSICDAGKLACRNKECINKELFCNAVADCSDGNFFRFII